MSKINVLSNYEFVKSSLNSPLNDYNPIQYLIIIKYLLTLRKNEDIKNNLDYDKKISAEFNDVVTSLISVYICQKVSSNEKNIFDFIKTETKRVNDVNERYSANDVKKLNEKEVRNLLLGILSNDELDDLMFNLFHNNGNVYKKENKVVPFRRKNR